MSSDRVQDHPGGYRNGDVVLVPCACMTLDYDCADGFHARTVDRNRSWPAHPELVPVGHAGESPWNIWLVRRTVWRLGDQFLLFDGTTTLLLDDRIEGPDGGPGHEWICREIIGDTPGSLMTFSEDALSRATPVLKGDVRMPFVRSTDWWRRHVWMPW